MAGYRSLARNRDFTTLWIGETVNELGSRMSLFVFPLLAYALTGSTLLAALTEGAHLLGLVVTLLPAGALVDRLHRGRLMRAASGSGALLYGSLAVAGATGHLTVPHLLVVGLLTGVGSGVFGPAQLSAIRTVVATDDLPTALSQNQARQHVAGLVGGPLGGALYAGARWLPFAVDALTFAISWVSIGRVRTDLSPVSTGEREPQDARSPLGRSPLGRLGADIAVGLRFVLSRPLFRVLLAWSASANLVNNALIFAVVLRMVQAGYHPAEIGLVSTAAGLGGIVGALAAPYLIHRMATGRLTVLISWSLVLPVLPLIWWATPAATGAALFVLLLLNPAGNAGMGAYRMAVTPADLQGRVSSASQFVSMSVMPLAPLLGSALLTWLGGPAATAVLAAATAGVALIVTCSPQVRAVPGPAGWPGAAPVAAGRAALG